MRTAKAKRYAEPLCIPDGDISAGGLTNMSGFTIIEAESMEAALALAADCPFLAIRGSLEVSELMPMPGAG